MAGGEMPRWLVCPNCNQIFRMHFQVCPFCGFVDKPTKNKEGEKGEKKDADKTKAP